MLKRKEHKPKLTSVHVDTDNPDVKTIKKAVNYEIVYSIIGICAGLIAIGFGVFLISQGFEDTTEAIFIKLLGISIKMKEFTSGALLIVAGIVIIVVTRYRVSLGRSKK